MNQFLDKILNPVPAIKRKSQTQNNHEVIKNTVNGFHNGDINNNAQYGLKQSQQQKSQPYNQGQCYQREQVTQQLIFERYEDDLNNQAQKSGQLHNSYSVGRLREVRQVKIINDNHNHEEYLRSEQSYPQNSQTVQQGRYRIGNIQNVEIHKRVASNKVVEELIYGINSAKQSHTQFLRWFSQQKLNFQQLIFLMKSKLSNKLQQTIQTIRQQVRQQVQNQHKSQQHQNHTNSKQPSQQPISILSNQKRWQIEKKLIKQELQQRYLYRIQKLQEQLAQKKHYQNQHIMTNDNNQHQAQMQKLNEQIEILHFQLQQKNTLITELQAENQKLNQHIFDVEQKVQGIELQVQKKVRQRVKELQAQQQAQLKSPQPLNPILQASSHLEQSSRAIGMMQSLNLNSQKIQELVSLNQILKNKLQQLLSEKSLLQNQIKEHQKILSFRQQQIQQNQHDINFEWAEIQKQRQSLLIRQQQLTTAEQNISKKISQIRYKQNNFDKWQNQLHTRQTNLDFKDQEFNRKLQNLVQRQNLFKTQKEKFNKEKQSYSTFTNNVKSRKNIQQFNVQGGTNYRQTQDVPQLPMSRKYYPQPDFKQQKSFENNQYQFKNKPDFMKIQLQRSYDDIDKSYNRPNRQRQRISIAGNNNFRPQARQNHQCVLPQNNSRIQHQSRSKSKSNQKIHLRNNFNPSSVGSNYKNLPYKQNTRFSEQIHQNKSQPNLDGLGSKLQRLREQIKREIDSIK